MIYPEKLELAVRDDSLWAVAYHGGDGWVVWSREGLRWADLQLLLGRMLVYGPIS